jgi:hypothetical protein
MVIKSIESSAIIKRKFNLFLKMSDLFIFSKDNPVFFTDAAKKSSRKIPAMGAYNPNFDSTSSKTRFVNMGNKPDKTPDWRIPKHDTGPAPGSYDAPGAIAKTQWHIKSGPKVWSEKRVVEFEQIAKRKKSIPGVGHYKKLVEGTLR